MCTLISRGDLNTSNPAGMAARSGITKQADTSGTSGHDDDALPFDLKPPKLEDHSRPMDYDDDCKIDYDLDKLLQHIKEEQQNSMDGPESPKDVHGVLGMGDSHHLIKSKPSRHLLYTTHFPLPQDESSAHDCNQRHVLLYGFGKVRDEARHQIKKIVKDIGKLFGKKFSIDVADGKVKKHSRSDFNFEATTARFQALSYFDQHYVTWQCSVTILELISAFESGVSNYLPVPEHVAFLFDLMELAFNIYGLIDLCLQILKEIPEVESQLAAKNSVLTKSYTNLMVLYIVGVLRRYHACLLLSPEQTIGVFEGLCRVVKHVAIPGDCSSVERCVLSHLYDLYSSCSLLKSRPHGGDPFSNAYPKIKQALYTSLTPSPSNHTAWNSTFMVDVIQTYKRGGEFFNICIFFNYTLSSFDSIMSI